LAPSPHRHQTQLKNPAGSECEDDNRPQDHREQERHRERQVPMEEEEVHLDALEVLEDEDQDHDEHKNTHRKRRPGSTQSGLALAWQRFPCFYILASGIFHRLNLALKRIFVEIRKLCDQLADYAVRSLPPKRLKLGDAVSFTWMSLMIAISIAAKIRCVLGKRAHRLRITRSALNSAVIVAGVRPNCALSA
jgi:hypothetical protein